MQQFFSDADAEGFTFNINTNEVYTTAGDGYWSNVVKNVTVTDIGIYISTLNEADEGDEDCYCDGDMYVCYDEATWDNSVDGLIYTDSAFLANVQDKVRDVLLQMNVDDDVANTLVADIHYSEQGMQDEGRVSLDAYALADFLRNYYMTELV
jgi:DNA-directed RNA polymerase alpha subunit